MTRTNTLIFISTFLFCVLPQLLTAQNLEWVAAFGGSESDWGRALATDASGNVYTVGTFRDTVDFDPGSGVFNLISARSSNNRALDEVFVQKLNPAGDLVWAKKFGGSQLETLIPASVDVDNQGNIVITGLYEGDSMDIAPGAPVVNMPGNDAYDIFVVKLNASGNLVWGISFAGDQFETPRTIRTDSLGNIYLCGSFEGTVDFDPGPGTNMRTATGNQGQSDLFVCKLTPSGNTTWVTTLGGSGQDVAEHLDIDASGFVYVGGRFNDTANFSTQMGNPMNVVSNGFADAFVLKLNPVGGTDWVRTFGGNATDNLYSLALDPQGDIVVTGEFSDTVDFDPGPGLNIVAPTMGSGGDAYVLKLNSSGAFDWVKTFGGSRSDRAVDHVIDDLGNIYSAGYFLDTVDFDPGSGVTIRISQGNFDGFIQKLDSDGNFVWVKTFGSPQQDYAARVCLDANRNVFVTGHFQDTVLFDPNDPASQQGSRGQFDVFLLKYSQGGTSTNIIEAMLQNEVLAYPNPTTGRVLLQLNAPTDQINVIVRNSLGQEIIQQSFQSTDLVELDINGSNGLYLLELNNAGKRTVIPVIKQ
jgi:hypothetical protein